MIIVFVADDYYEAGPPGGGGGGAFGGRGVGPPGGGHGGPPPLEHGMFRLKMRGLPFECSTSEIYRVSCCSYTSHPKTQHLPSPPPNMTSSFGAIIVFITIIETGRCNFFQWLSRLTIDDAAVINEAIQLCYYF